MVPEPCSCSTGPQERGGPEAPVALWWQPVVPAGQQTPSGTFSHSQRKFPFGVDRNELSVSNLRPFVQLMFEDLKVGWDS